MYNTLTIKIMGMIESKKPKAKKQTGDNYASDYHSDAGHEQ